MALWDPNSKYNQQQKKDAVRFLRKLKLIIRDMRKFRRVY